ncbi:group III truncated hemoglobin [Pannonibacter sp. Pt2-lr]
MDSFYDAVRADERLGPIFEARMAGHWDAHLERMKSFWGSVLLKTGEYKGRPVPAHLPMRQEVESDDFRRWLTLFRQTARSVFADPEAAAIVIRQAERIATSLWLAMLGTPSTARRVFCSGGIGRGARHHTSGLWLGLSAPLPSWGGVRGGGSEPATI